MVRLAGRRRQVAAGRAFPLSRAPRKWPIGRCTPKSLWIRTRPESPRSPSSYFLYVAIFAETALAAVIYKVILRDPELANLRVYFAIFFFAFLAWAIAQLTMLHRERSAGVIDPMPIAEEEPVQPAHRSTPAAFGLTAAQLAIVVVVFATAIATFSCAIRLLR